MGRAKDTDAYLASLPPKVRAGLQKLRKTIRATVPDAEEGFSYGMPAFRLRGRPLIAFAAAEDHSSLYPMSAAVIRALAPELKNYETSKGTVRFPPDRPPPARLVAKILKARMAELRPRRA
jgi:uncharacterized protein YdhG (YjbR/CyaY superfamily)